MSAADFATLGGTLLALASSIQTLGSNYYQADAAWDAFPLKVLSLEEKHARLQALLERYGQDGSALGLGVLQRAKELMLKEEKTLKRREEATKGGRRLINRYLAPLRHWRGIAFPGTIGLAIQNAEAAYDGLERQLKSQQENEEMLRGFANRALVAPSFREDRRHLYVSLPLSESRIVNALKTEGVDSPSVILLHGGPGTGKSTVTREIMLRCAREKMFTHVVRLECGLSVDVGAKEVELLQKLGWNDLPEMSQLSSKEDGSKLVRQSRLQSLLAKQKLLIGLDDLWDHSLLQRLLIQSGPNVRYLVTSQRGDICEHLNCIHTKVLIEDDLTGNNAKEICKHMLAAHIGFSAGTIPDHMQEVADKILCQAEGIPLVIATLGAQIGKGDKDDLAVWRSVSAIFLQCLENEKPSMLVHGVPYEKSYWSALKSSIDSLGDDVKQMLLLISMCRGPSVPQGIVFLLFNTMCPEGKRTMMHFTQMQNELKSRQLVSHNSEKDLSVHSLAKSCILKQMSETIESIAGLFIPIDSGTGVQESTGFVTRTTIIHVLVCLYLDEGFGNQVARQMDYSLNTFSESKKTAIQSITQQLAMELECTGELHQSASQVFVQFVCEDSLCADHLLQLLQCLTWRMPTLTFLQSISALDESFWKKNTIRGILPMFESILGDSHQPDMQIEAAKTLRILVPQGTNCKDILNRKRLPQQLVDLMRQAHNASVQSSGAGFFVACTYYLSDNFLEEKFKFNLVQLPQFLPILVESLGDGWNAGLQKLAANVLLNLATTNNISLLHQILRFPLLVDSLAASLKKSENPKLQVNAALAISNFACPRADQAVKEEIANNSGLLDNLESSLDQDSNPMLQVSAAKALIRLERMEDTPKLLRILVASLEARDNANLQNEAATGLQELAKVDDVSRDQIVSFPGLLESLTRVLDDNVNLGLQAQLVGILQNLTSTANGPLTMRILNSPMLLGRVVASLKKSENPELQVNAAAAIFNFARPRGDQAVKEEITNNLGLLDNMESSLDQDSNQMLQVLATRALIRLERMEDTPKLLRILVASLEARDNADLQNEAATGLQELAHVDDVSRDQIVSFPGLLESLTRLLDGNVNLGLQAQLVGILQNLTSTADGPLTMRILNSPLLLGRVVASLKKSENPELQVNAAAAIFNFARPRGDQAVKEEIANNLGLLDNLESSLDQDSNPMLQVSATRALIILERMEDTPKLLQILVASLELRDNPDLQNKATMGLNELARVNAVSKDQIVNFPALLVNLVKLFDDDMHSGLQSRAASVLISVSDAKQTSTKAQMMSSPLLLDSVVASLRKHQNPALQRRAACIIANLTGEGANQAIRDQVANFPGLLNDLEDLLDRDDEPGLRGGAARALVTLAPTKDTSKLVDILAVLLEGNQDRWVKAGAAEGLGDLAGEGDDEIKSQILSFPGLLSNLARSLDEDADGFVSMYAARALLKLSSSQESSIKERIVREPLLLERLITSLGRIHDFDFQRNAVCVIVNLSEADVEIRQEMVKSAGLVEELVKLLAHDDSVLQQEAALALSNLEQQLDVATQTKFGHLQSSN